MNTRGWVGVRRRMTGSGRASRLIARVGWSGLVLVSMTPTPRASEPPPRVVGHLTIAGVDGLARALVSVYERLGMDGLVDADRMGQALLARAPRPLRTSVGQGPVTLLLVEAGGPSLDVAWVALEPEDSPGIDPTAATGAEGFWSATTPEKHRVIFAAREGLARSLVALVDARVDPPREPGVVTFALDVADLLATRGTSLEGQVHALRFAARASRFLGKDGTDAELTADWITFGIALARVISSLGGEIELDPVALRCDLVVTPVSDGDLAGYLLDPPTVGSGYAPARAPWAPGEFARLAIAGGVDSLVGWLGGLDIRSADRSWFAGPGSRSSEVMVDPRDRVPLALSVLGRHASGRSVPARNVPDPNDPADPALWTFGVAGIDVVRFAAPSKPLASGETMAAEALVARRRVLGLWIAAFAWSGEPSQGPARIAEVKHHATFLVEARDGRLGLQALLPLEVFAACIPSLEFR